jgi:hypothetical protein
MSYNEKNPPVDKRCAPDKKGNKDSCYDLESLQTMVEEYNDYYDDLETKNKFPKGKIGYTKEQFQDRKFLLKELADKLENVCDNQLCWLKVGFLKKMDEDKIKKTSFRPEGPSKKSEQYKWLSNRDIDNVLFQYQKVYHDFAYLDTVPIDFANLNYKVSNMDLKKLQKNNINRIGVVFNLDRHDQKGSHWVALYSDLNKKQIYFFDSYGMKPEKEIKELMAKIANYLTNSNNYTASNILSKNKNQSGGTSIDIRYNTQQHQQGGSECGVYCISFILRLLNGEPFNNIINNRVPDEKVNKCRNYYFTH